ncbi:hypothetical protein SS50377_20913 [Spironucleus salmonicida]|uniref:Uncharacterized protein n=1 Tax=Spironucleus salmonicida TaxID=348837 RepID=V6LGD4_9EUKA|nr:hypothetical protein SS50377_20913 [Spironucleus salmonicida]|eukprot:EST43587.1 Hypothetical protein SS50377_16628 [Spironucleus salmonicida]
MINALVIKTRQSNLPSTFFTKLTPLFDIVQLIPSKLITIQQQSQYIPIYGVTAISLNRLGLRTGDIVNFDNFILQKTPNFMEQVRFLSNNFELYESGILSSKGVILKKKVSIFVEQTFLIFAQNDIIQVTDIDQLDTIFEIQMEQRIEFLAIGFNEILAASKNIIYRIFQGGIEVITRTQKDITGLIFTNQIIYTTYDSICTVNGKRELFFFNQKIISLLFDEKYIYIFSARRIVILTHKLTVVLINDFNICYRCFYIENGLIKCGNRNLDIYQICR